MTPREIKSMCADAGLEVLEIVPTRHWKVRVRNNKGEVHVTIFPRTMGDNARGWKNKVAQLRQIARAK